MNRLTNVLIVCLLVGCAAQYQGEVEYYEPPETTTIIIEHYGGVREIEIQGAISIIVKPAEGVEVIINGKEATHENQQEQSSYTSGGADEAQ